MSGALETTEETGVRLVRRMLDEGFAGGDVAVVDELCAPDLVEHQFGLAGGGAEAIAHVKRAMLGVHAGLPDLVYTVESSAVAGDVVWVRSTGRATATGPFFGPPSGRPVEFTVIDVVRVEHGRIAEHWGVPDRFAVLAQIGALERLVEPEGAAAR